MDFGRTSCSASITFSCLALLTCAVLGDLKIRRRDWEWRSAAGLHICTEAIRRPAASACDRDEAALESGRLDFAVVFVAAAMHRDSLVRMGGNRKVRQSGSPARSRGRNSQSVSSFERNREHLTAPVVHAGSRTESSSSARSVCSMFFMCQTAFTLAVRWSLRRSSYPSQGCGTRFLPKTARVVACRDPSDLAQHRVLYLRAADSASWLCCSTKCRASTGSWRHWRRSCFMGLPLWPAWSWLFPKLWLLIFLFIVIGYPRTESDSRPLRRSRRYRRSSGYRDRCGNRRIRSACSKNRRIISPASPPEPGCDLLKLARLIAERIVI